MPITRAVKKPRASKKSDRLDADAFIEGAVPEVAPIVVAAPTASESAEALPARDGVPLPARPQTDAAMHIVRRHMPWAAGAGLVPLPGVDLASIATVQLHMMTALATHYGVAFNRDAAKSVAATLMATVLERSLAGGMGSLIKLLPGVGTVAGLLVLPGMAAAATYAMGRVFVMHFESGGTFLDLDPAKAEAHFREALAKGPACA
jgi:uncharacterized protein (DUF697 family)